MSWKRGILFAAPPAIGALLLLVHVGGGKAMEETVVPSVEALDLSDVSPAAPEVGLPLRPDLHLDGVSFAPLLKGDNKPLHDALFWHYPHYAAYGCGPFSAIRKGDWKLIEWLEDGSLDLFNLAEDVGEKNNLAEAMPDKAKAMRSELHRWREDVDANMPRTR